MKEIDLGKKLSEPCCAPENKSSKTDLPQYPSLYVDGGKALSDLPEEGTMTVRYRRRSLTTREGEDGTTRSAEFEILATTGAEANSNGKDDDKERESALDKLAEEESEGSDELG